MDQTEIQRIIVLGKNGPDSEGWLSGARWQIQFGLDGFPGQIELTNGDLARTRIGPLGFLVSPNMYRTSSLKTKIALETGIYIIKGYTLGYVQKKDISVYAAKGQQADTKLNLVQEST